MDGIGWITSIAAMIGDPARANMLFAMKDDGLITAGALARIAGIAPSTASGHLAKLCEAGLVRVEAEGRLRRYDLVDPRVGEVLEGIGGLAEWLIHQHAPDPRTDVVRVHVRCCYDHLSGAYGGKVAEVALARGYVASTPEGLDVTAEGAEWLDGFGIDVSALREDPRRLVGLCADWRTHSVHLGGNVGAALLAAWRARDWLRPGSGQTELRLTPKGIAGLRRELGIELRPAAE